MQSRALSIAEATSNVVAGYGIAIVLTWCIYGIGLAQSARGSFWYVLASLVRGYVIRRAFTRAGVA
jgi:hypothetical protein